MLGKRLWRATTRGNIAYFFDVVSGRVVYHEKRGGDPAVVVLRDNGKVLWEREFAHDSVRLVRAGADALFLEGYVATRLSLQTGEIEATRTFEERVAPSAISPRFVVYRGQEPGRVSSFTALVPETLDLLWQRPALPYAAAHDYRICRYTPEGVIEILDLEPMGEPRVVQGPLPPESGGRGHVHVEHLWYEFYDRHRMGIDTVSGNTVWHVEEAKSGYHDFLRFDAPFAYSGSHGLSAYDLRTGEVRWRRDFEGYISTPPHVLDGRLYVGSEEGAFHIVEPGTGDLIFSHQVGFKPRKVVPLDPHRVVVASSETIVCVQVL